MLFCGGAGHIMQRGNQQLQPARGLFRAVADLGQGVKQLYLHATDPEAAKEYGLVDQITQPLEAGEDDETES